MFKNKETLSELNKENLNIIWMVLIFITLICWALIFYLKIDTILKPIIKDTKSSGIQQTTPINKLDLNDNKKEKTNKEIITSTKVKKSNSTNKISTKLEVIKSQNKDKIQPIVNNSSTILKEIKKSSVPINEVTSNKQKIKLNDRGNFKSNSEDIKTIKENKKCPYTDSKGNCTNLKTNQ